MNNVLKDINGNILDPIIPRYEKGKGIKFGEPFKTGRKILYDNQLRDEYGLFFDVGMLPNAGNKSIELGSFNFKNKLVTEMRGSSVSAIGEVVPFPRYVNSSSNIGCAVVGSNKISIDTVNDSSRFHGIVYFSYINTNS